MSFELKLILNCTATALSAAYCLLLFSSALRYCDILKAVDRSIFPMPHLLRTGFEFQRIAGKKFMQVNLKLSEILKCDDFTAYCTFSWLLSVLLPMTALTLFICAFTSETVFLFCGPVCSLALSVAPMLAVRERAKERQKNIERELPCAISKTVLLTGAGLTVIKAWETVAYSAEGALYDEMRNSFEQIQNGVSPADAFQSFAVSCGTKEARQFVGILGGSMSRGGSGMCEALRYLNAESWEGRKQRAKLESQAAASALLLPMIVMFIGIVLMIAIPLLEKITY